jgi:hypothetical protein
MYLYIYQYDMYSDGMSSMRSVVSAPDFSELQLMHNSLIDDGGKRKLVRKYYCIMYIYVYMYICTYINIYLYICICDARFSAE